MKPEYLLSIIFPVADQYVVHEFRLATEASPSWVKDHADELARRITVDHSLERFGPYVALWVKSSRRLFVVDGRAYTAEQMLKANADDPDLCDWIRGAKPGDLFPDGAQCLCVEGASA